MQNKPSDSELVATIDKVFNQIQQFEELKTWEKVDDDPCELYTMEIDERVAAKGIIVIKNCHLEKVLDFFKLPDFMKKVNEKCQKMEILYEKSKQLRVIYIQMSGFGPVSAREMVAVTSFKKVNDKKIYVGMKSCNYPYPQNPDIVRGEIVLAGYIIEQINENSVRLTHLSDIDIKGSIPGFIKNKIASQRGTAVAAIAKYLK